MSPDRAIIQADGKDLSFVTVSVVDKDGLVVPAAEHKLSFSIKGPGEIVATDNGDPTNFTSFKSHDRKAFNGLCLVIVRAKQGSEGIINLIASSSDLQEAVADIAVKPSL